MIRFVSGPIPNVRPSKETRLAPFPGRLASGLGAWILFMVLGTEVWYRAHETRATLHWSIEWPVAKKDFSDLVIPQPAADMLRFDEGRAASWTDRDGSSWTAFFFKWVAGPPRSRILARGHRPEVYLPAAGYKLQADRGTITNRCQRINHSVPRLRFRLRWPPSTCLLLPLAGWLKRRRPAQNLGRLDPPRETRDGASRGTQSRSTDPGDSDLRIRHSPRS
jgi:hypothetical protein